MNMTLQSYHSTASLKRIHRAERKVARKLALVTTAAEASRIGHDMARIHRRKGAARKAWLMQEAFA